MGQAKITIIKNSKSICIVYLLVSTIFPTFVNIETFAQTPSTQMQCSEVEIKNNIQKLSNSEQSAYEALVACKDKAVPELIAANKSQNQQVRIMAITALGEIGSPNAFVPLKDLLSSEILSDVRVSVIFALSKFGKQGVPILITALKDRDWYIRYYAANVLGKIGSDAKNAVAALNDAAKDDNLNVRSAATTALVEIQKQKISKLESIVISLRDVVPDESQSIDVPRIESAIRSERKRPTRTVSQNLTQDSRQPLMCRVSALRYIFKWKCG